MSTVNITSTPAPIGIRTLAAKGTSALEANSLTLTLLWNLNMKGLWHGFCYKIKIKQQNEAMCVKSVFCWMDICCFVILDLCMYLLVCKLCI